MGPLMYFIFSLLLSNLLSGTLCVYEFGNFLQVIIWHFDFEMNVLFRLGVTVVKLFKNLDLIKLD